jgi:hypothetical protein
MNRIILIGNGFDLAHNMPTSYKDFINNYFQEFCKEAYNKTKNHNNDDLELQMNRQQSLELIVGNNEVKTTQDFYKKFKSFNESNYLGAKATIKYSNLLLRHIAEKMNLENWVDVENEFYLHLIEAAKTEMDSLHITKMPEYIDVNTLNENLDSISVSLESYLSTIEKNYLPSHDTVQQIKYKIYSKLNFRDISLPFIDTFLDEIKNKMEHLKDKNTSLDSSERKMTEYSQVYQSLDFYTKDILEFCEQNSSFNYDKERLKQKFERGLIPDYFMVPENILFLTFNYTHTEKVYLTQSYLIDTIHIHGEIDNKENPIIFGYGDELEESYKTIENLKDNRFLNNMKSIHYLRTANYKKLLNFIESQPYQIFIMGHSCGNSDRTLLNTLFEHKNCASIKPYFHQIDDNKDNYNEIIQNISRNFNDKVMMRDRVVNKTFCEPLLE